MGGIKEILTDFDSDTGSWKNILMGKIFTQSVKVFYSLYRIVKTSSSKPYEKFYHIILIYAKNLALVIQIWF